MDYEKKYNEALDRAREIKSKILSSHLSTESCKAVSEYIDTIIPELAESKDEKMTRIIGLALTDVPEERFVSLGTTLKDCLAYLEKQKEQKPNIELIQKSWYMEGYHDRDFGNEPKWVIKTGEGGPRYEENPKYGQMLEAEQKPIEWKPLPESMEALMLAIEGDWDAIKPTGYMSRRLEDLYDGLVNTFDVDEKYLDNMPKTACTEKDIEEIKALKEKIDSSMEQKPAELSEEDEDNLKRAINICVNDFGEESETAKFLKSLPERFNLHSKQEWSEEDEKALNGIIKAVEEGRLLSLVQLHWLKSLRPPLKDREMKLKILKYLSTRCSSLEFEEIEDYLNNLHSSWKPSEEQMKALSALNCHGELSYVGQQNQLISLQNDLKKLM